MRRSRAGPPQPHCSWPSAGISGTPAPGGVERVDQARERARKSHGRDARAGLRVGSSTTYTFPATATAAPPRVRPSLVKCASVRMPARPPLGAPCTWASRNTPASRRPPPRRCTDGARIFHGTALSMLRDDLHDQVRPAAPRALLERVRRGQQAAVGGGRRRRRAAYMDVAVVFVPQAVDRAADRHAALLHMKPGGQVDARKRRPRLTVTRPEPRRSSACARQLMQHGRASGQRRVNGCG